MRLEFRGAAKTVTGSCFLVDTTKTRFLVDCGLFQGSRRIKERNYDPFPFDPTSIQFVLLTHAHIDHSGLLPKLVKHGFKGSVIATVGTRDLCEIMLPDSAYVQEMEVERKNRKGLRAGRKPLEPIYSIEDARTALGLFETVQYGEVVTLSPDVRACLVDAGHILGSSAIEVWIGRDHPTKLVFSGDIGARNRPIINDPDGVPSADYIVIESTYGDRLRSPHSDPASELKTIVEQTLAQGGNVVIPAFAVERTQDLLYTLHKIKLNGDLQDATIYLDSPMAQSATDVFCRHYDYYDEEARELADKLGKCPLYVPKLLYSRTAEESRALNEIQKGAVILSASGMCDAGRVKHHLKHNLWRKECTVLLVGYQAIGTLGRQLLDGAKRVRIHGEEIQVRATIKSIDGFSAHADQRDLLSWLSAFRARPSTVFVTHGEEKASTALAGLISQELGLEALVPELDDVVILGRGRSSIKRKSGTTMELDEQCVLDVEHTYLNLGDSIRNLLCKGDTSRTRERILPLLEQLNEAISEEMALQKSQGWPSS